jgi:large subunit ribosomal protein L10
MANSQKVEAVAELRKLFEGSESFFVTDYHGLNVSDLTVLRKNLRDNKIKYLVAKNTLFKIAAREAGMPAIDEHLLGPTAVAFTNADPAIAAKILHDAYKEKERPRMKVFVIGKQLYEAGQAKRLAELPPRNVLYSQGVGAVESPLTSLVATLDGFFRELIGSIDALAEKRKAS